jgi:hypothetical protein
MWGSPALPISILVVLEDFDFPIATMNKKGKA